MPCLALQGPHLRLRRAACCAQPPPIPPSPQALAKLKLSCTSAVVQAMHKPVRARVCSFCSLSLLAPGRAQPLGVCLSRQGRPSRPQPEHLVRSLQPLGGLGNLLCSPLPAGGHSSVLVLAALVDELAHPGSLEQRPHALHLQQNPFPSQRPPAACDVLAEVMRLQSGVHTSNLRCTPDQEWAVHGGQLQIGPSAGCRNGGYATVSQGQIPGHGCLEPVATPTAVSCYRVRVCMLLGLGLPTLCGQACMPVARYLGCEVIQRDTCKEYRIARQRHRYLGGEVAYKGHVQGLQEMFIVGRNSGAQWQGTWVVRSPRRDTCKGSRKCLL